jgi:hypothetical protein
VLGFLDNVFEGSGNAQHLVPTHQAIHRRRGTEIHYTSDGLSSIPPHAREKLLFMVLAEFKKPGAGNARGDRS